MKAFLSVLIIGGIAGVLIYARRPEPKAVPIPPRPAGFIIDKPTDPLNFEQKVPSAEEEARYAAALKECIRRKKEERAYFSEDVPSVFNLKVLSDPGCQLSEAAKQVPIAGHQLAFSVR